jgi:hypothetical protein
VGLVNSHFFGRLLVLGTDKPAVNCAAFVLAKMMPDLGISSLCEVCRVG